MLPCLVFISLWLKPWKKTLRKSSSHSFIDYWRYGKGHAHAGTDSRASTKHSRYRTYLCCYHSGWNWRLFSLFKARQASCLFRYWPLCNAVRRVYRHTKQDVKKGSRLLRRVLFTIALANIRTKRDKTACNPVLMEYYKNKCQSKPKKVALGAVMRKLVNYILLFLGIESLTNYVLPKSTRKCLQRSTQQLSSTCTRCLVFKNQFTISGQLFYVY